MIRKYRCFSLWQPWASLMSLGKKTLETRSWNTTYRGPIAIHAAKTEKMMFLCDVEPFGSSLFMGENTVDDLPIGAVVAVGELTATWTTDHVNRLRFPIGKIERAFGDFSDGRFAWQIAHVRRLKTPIPMRGQQGFWDVMIDDDCIEGGDAA